MKPVKYDFGRPLWMNNRLITTEKVPFRHHVFCELVDDKWILRINWFSSEEKQFDSPDDAWLFYNENKINELIAFYRVVGEYEWKTSVNFQGKPEDWNKQKLLWLAEQHLSDLEINDCYGCYCFLCGRLNDQVDDCGYFWMEKNGMIGSICSCTKPQTADR